MRGGDQGGKGGVCGLACCGVFVEVDGDCADAGELEDGEEAGVADGVVGAVEFAEVLDAEWGRGGGGGGGGSDELGQWVGIAVWWAESEDVQAGE